MAKIDFTSALKRFFPNIKQTNISATSLPELLDKLEAQHPGIKDYIVEEDGSLRKHINIFVDGQLISDRQQLSDPIKEEDEILIFQALSGG